MTNKSIVKAYDFPNYSVKIDGTVVGIRRRTEKFNNWPIIGTLDKHGKPTINLYKDGRQFRRYKAKLVLESFGRHPKYGQVVGYKDGNPRNCRLENLFWSYKKNKPAHCKGGKKRVRLTGKEILDVLWMRGTLDMTFDKISKATRIKPGVVRRVCYTPVTALCEAMGSW